MKRTLKTLMVLAAFAGFATAANAVSLVTTSNQGIYNPGETITLTVLGTTTDTPLTTDVNIIGRIVHTTAGVVSLNNVVQTPMPGWSNGVNPACTTAECPVFNQITFPVANNPNVTGFALATSGYTAGPTNTSGWRVATFSWKTVGTGKLDFFGLTNAPGVSVTIVPEPTTAAMLGLGLLGLALAGRRRA